MGKVLERSTKQFKTDNSILIGNPPSFLLSYLRSNRKFHNHIGFDLMLIYLSDTYDTITVTSV